MRTITITKIRGLRGITYLLNGQQFAGWLPVGTYNVLGQCVVKYSDLGRVSEVSAIKVARVAKDGREETWYVATSAIADGWQAAFLEASITL